MSLVARVHLAIVGALGVAAFAVPAYAQADVVINEIAWMGTADSANNEWIELKNTGSSPVDLSGWQLTSSTGAPDIALTGSVSAHGFYMLERTSEATLPAIPADQIYTGALANAGATLTLTNASGAMVDRVVGGSDWKAVGGDNATKETAQRTSAGWETAAPTPDAPNAVPTSSGTQNQSSSGDSSSANASNNAQSSGGSAQPYTPPSALTVSLSGPHTVSLHVPATFSAVVRTATGKRDPAAQLHWSFGDGSTQTGSPVTKLFRYPGTYVVTVTAHDDTATAQATHTIVATTTQVAIQTHTADGVVLVNHGNSRADISGWWLRAGARRFRFPEGTLLAPQATVLFPYTVTDLPRAAAVQLFYPDDSPVWASQAPQAPSAHATMQPSTSTASYKEQRTTGSSRVINSITAQAYGRHTKKALIAPAAPTHIAAAGASSVPADTASATAASTSVADPTQALPVKKGGSGSSYWLYGALGVLALVGGAVLVL